MMYSVDMKESQFILGYSDLFSAEKPNLIERIQKMNMHKTISIISELIQIRDAKCDPINISGIEVRFPFETILKRDYCEMRPESSKEMMENVMLRKNQHIISLQMLLFFLKKVIAHGDYESLKIKDYEINDEDYREVIMLQLLVAEEVSDKHEINIDTNHFLYATYHLNYQRNVANQFSRMYYIMECLSKDSKFFDDIKGEYRNYYVDFTSQYGVNPTEYNSLLFYELECYYSEKNFLSKSKCWRNIELIYKDVKEKEKISKVIDILKIEPIRLKEWAINTEKEEWNYISFYKFPFIFDGESDYISISDITLINAFFEKIFWLIRDCYPKEDSRAMAFFGHLFERYIQNATKDACINDSIYIDEFQFQVKKNKRKSSDAYIRKGEYLLVVEAKGFSVLVDCMAKNEKIENNNKKLFVKPILQADDCLDKSFDSKKEFIDIKEAFIISVTLDNINAVPNYYNDIHEEIEEKKKCRLVNYYFNFSIEEYEMLLYLIEQDIDIFPMLKDYFLQVVLSPFSNYIRKRVPDVNMTKFMAKNYEAATSDMKRILL